MRPERTRGEIEKNLPDYEDLPVSSLPVNPNPIPKVVMTPPLVDQETLQKELKALRQELNISLFNIRTKTEHTTDGLLKELKALRQELADIKEGVKDNSEFLLDLNYTLIALVEQLVEKGVTTINEIDERAEQSRFSNQSKGVAIRELEEDKGEEVLNIDCNNRVRLCKAACCRMSFKLSKQEIVKGDIKWDLSEPYWIALGTDGYCQHLKRDSSKQCSIYLNRPHPCRIYDCRGDDRIWTNYEKYEANPKLDEIFQINDKTPPQKPLGDR